MSATAAEPDAARRAAASRARLGWRRSAVLVAFAAAVGLLLALRVFVVEPFSIPSSSMEPTLRPGDHVLVEKLALRSSEPQRGDLVVFEAPGSGEIMLKRVVALPGDTVGLEDGVLIVNGQSVVEPYVDHAGVDSVYYGPVEVPDEGFMVMGDNRGLSVDSREFGAVPRSSLIGRVLVRVWPPWR